MQEKYITDQMGVAVNIPEKPGTIVSLVPSQTELLFDLGLDEEVKGITKFCIHPTHWRKNKTIVGGTKKFDFDVIHNLKPDLIIGNKEENYEEGIRELANHYPVWMSDINTLQHAIDMIQQIGKIVDRNSKAKDLIQLIETGFKKINPSVSRKRALYFIWYNPWMVAGTNTFINDMMQYAGFENAMLQPRYPELTEEMIHQINPEVILLSSEPFPFKEKHVEELKIRFPQSQVMIVDGEMFSWYGSRLRYAPDYFITLQQLLV